jgi:hypothetical protein
MKELKFYEGNIVPEDGTIFVFGSNPEGRHGAGSAAAARKFFGAIYGQGEGLQGSSYALPTTELRPEYQDADHSMSRDKIVNNIKRMYQCALANPDKKFKVAYRNQPNEVTLCGYAGWELMSMFKEACNGNYPDNIYFSKEWVDSGLL